MRRSLLGGRRRSGDDTAREHRIKHITIFQMA
jgi:hypothetical protein